MYISYFPNQTAQKSEPIWQSFLDSCKKFNITPVENSTTADAALIWSVLWQGRMSLNEQVYENYRKQGKPVFILEVGALDRGRTWKVAANNITKNGIYANDSDLDDNRSKKLGIELGFQKINQDLPILIATQHEFSLQWAMPCSVREWTITQIKNIQKFTKKKIVVRPHPRFDVGEFTKYGAGMSTPIKILNTYDKYDLNFDYSAIINFNSGVAVQAAINGIPIITDTSSLAHDVSMPIDHCNDTYIPNREQWLKKLVHTEWTQEEIAEGLPLKRILRKLNLTPL
jgi:hypothetical protein